MTSRIVNGKCMSDRFSHRRWLRLSAADYWFMAHLMLGAHILFVLWGACVTDSMLTAACSSNRYKLILMVCFGVCPERKRVLSDVDTGRPGRSEETDDAGDGVHQTLSDSFVMRLGCVLPVLEYVRLAAECLWNIRANLLRPTWIVVLYAETTHIVLFIVFLFVVKIDAR